MPGNPRLRAAHADRDRVAALLREHLADGRLTTGEFGERLSAAFAAKTMGELDELMADLPAIDLHQLPDNSLARQRSPMSTSPGSTSPGSTSVAGRGVSDKVARAAAIGAAIGLYVVSGVYFGIWWIPWWLIILFVAYAMARRGRGRLRDDRYAIALRSARLQSR
jgi:hypothetical protein